MSRLARFAALTLGYNVLVVLWGALVRATGSGAGCGSHWPLCDGEVLPRAPATETVIELTHRVTSGLALALVIALVVLVYRRRPAGHPARPLAMASLVLILIEAALGAGVVLLELVGENSSATRAWWMMGHLVNTFFLLGALALTTWSLAGGAMPRWRGQRRAAALLGLALAAMLATGASGAVTALGDTLYPATSLAEGMRQDLGPEAHLLLRLRIVHPLVAVGTALLLLWLPSRLRVPGTRALGGVVGLLALVQLAAGAVNVSLLAPIWMQMVHLLLADALWIALVLYGAQVLSRPAPERVVAPQVGPVIEAGGLQGNSAR